MIESIKAKTECFNKRKKIDDLCLSETSLEARIKILEAKNAELNEINKVFTGREFRIKELKTRVAELEERLLLFEN